MLPLGQAYSFHLRIFDEQKKVLKDNIHISDIVTIRAGRDCYFQLFLTSGKIVQFRTKSMESQAHWMAMVKMALGKGLLDTSRMIAALMNIATISPAIVNELMLGVQILKLFSVAND